MEYFIWFGVIAIICSLFSLHAKVDTLMDAVAELLDNKEEEDDEQARP